MLEPWFMLQEMRKSREWDSRRGLTPSRWLNYQHWPGDSDFRGMKDARVTGLWILPSWLRKVA